MTETDTLSGGLIADPMCSSNAKVRARISTTYAGITMLSRRHVQKPSARRTRFPFARLLKATERLQLYRRATAIVFICMVAAGNAPAAHAVGITTYGTGLLSCSAYVDAMEQENAVELHFIDWLIGYLSGVNATSTHRNNILARGDVTAAMYWLGDYCRAHPPAHFADAVGMLLLTKTSGMGVHTVEVTAYGSGFKSCQVYLKAREPEDIDRMEFIDWLGGYLSGVNAMSNTTHDILGATGLKDALLWVEDYCSDHLPTPFSVAVEALVAVNRPIKVDEQLEAGALERHSALAAAP